MARRSFIRGTGGYLPEKILTNDELSKMVDTTDEWIRERTGIKRRHVAADGELTSDIATAAARNALEAAGIPVSEVDLIVLATTTPDQTFPATATAVQAKLGMTGGAAFIWDPTNRFERVANPDSIDWHPLPEMPAEHIGEAKALIEEHARRTGSVRAKDILDDWERAIHDILMIVPKEIADLLLVRTKPKSKKKVAEKA